MTFTFIRPVCDNVNWIKDRPIAHRGLHNAEGGIFENTLSACKAAMDANYAIEVDLQPSADGVPMVFHDYTLDRITDRTGDVRDCLARELQEIRIMDTQDTIPTLKQLLDLIQGKVGIVLELKGKPGNDNGFVKSVTAELESYPGNAAIMSFHHHILEDARELKLSVPLGLTAEGDDKHYDMHRAITDKAEPDFLSYEVSNLDCRYVAEYQKTKRPIICWTVRTSQDMAMSAAYAHQPTFEGFMA
ncbi:MAG: glycerophosphodiester phosphodiesterase family protein [Rhizobiaceae bacterium]|nr:glycerophosphodiester phosphodiesterase family protein [Rhizobiaceae bacterium]